MLDSVSLLLPERAALMSDIPWAKVQPSPLEHTPFWKNLHRIVFSWIPDDAVESVSESGLDISDLVVPCCMSLLCGGM